MLLLAPAGKTGSLSLLAAARAAQLARAHPPKGPQAAFSQWKCERDRSFFDGRQSVWAGPGR